MPTYPSPGGWCLECYARYGDRCAAQEATPEPSEIDFNDADDVSYCAFFISGPRARQYILECDQRNPNPLTRSGLKRQSS